MGCNLLSADEGHGDYTFVEVDVRIVGEDLIEKVERQGYICTVDRQRFHEADEGVLHKMCDLCYLVLIWSSHQHRIHIFENFQLP